MTAALVPSRLIDRVAVSTGRALIRWADRHHRAESRTEVRRRFVLERDRELRERSTDRFLPLARR